MKRSLSLFDVVCIGLNAIVGSGIFMLPDELAREMGLFSPLAFVLCAAGLLPVALCYAEAASRVDRTGGPYVYAREAFGVGPGFIVGWMCVANAMFSFAAVASAASAYAGRIFPRFASPLGLRLVALAIVLVFAALNYRGARPGSRAVNLFTIAKFGVLFTLVLSLVPHVSSAPAHAELPRGMAGVSAATFAALFAAQGFEVVPVPAGETRSPSTAIPKAVVGSLLAASFVYVIVQTTLVLSYPQLASPSDAPLADAALAVVPGLAIVVLFGGLISTLGFVSGSALGTPRYLYAMGLDGLLPRALASVHPRFHSPHYAVVVTGAVVSLLISALDYRALFGMSNVTVAVQYLSTCLAVIVMRRAQPPRGLAFTRFLMPASGIVVSLWIFTEASAQELRWALGSLVVGGVLVLARRARG